MVLLSKRVKLVPNRTMQTVLDKNCDYRRYCWNQGLALWEDTYTARDYMLPDSIKEKVKLELKGEKVSFTEEEMALRAVYPAPSERKVRDQLVEEKADWQYSYSARILQLAIKDLSIAYRSYYTKATERWGRPKFKSKKDTKQGFKTDRASIVNGKLRLDKPREVKDLWYDIPFKGYALPDGKVKHLSVTRKHGSYYATIIVEVTITPLSPTGKKTAVDANVNAFYYTDGVCKVVPEKLLTLYETIRHYQRILARKRKVHPTTYFTSHNYQKVKTKLQKAYTRVAAIQNDILHQFTTRLVRDYDQIVIEDLDVQKMQMQKKAKNLHRSLFGRFRLYMEYKTALYGRELVLADRTYPSTQRCSACGHVKQGEDRITLSGNQKHGTKHHEYICYECGFTCHRDENAVLNLLALAN